MTVKLYDTLPYERTFTATVQSCLKADPAEGSGGEIRFAVTLNQTLFFPEEGGQTPDTGILTPLDSRANKPSAAVSDVQIKGDEIIHFCSIPLEPGSKVTGRIDWAHRFDNMQQHTGEHIISGLVNKYYHLNNVGFHLSDDTVTMDYDGELTPEQIEKLEMLANQAVWDNRTVTAWYPPADELASLNYRSKLDLAENVRLVRIEGVDLCACCAPHVRCTGEIGMIKIVDFRRYKGGMRLWIVCGGRALADYRMLHDQTGAISFDLSAPRDDLMPFIRAQKDEISKLKEAGSRMGASLLQKEIQSVPADRKHVILFEEDFTDDKAVRDCLNELAAGRSGWCVCFYNRSVNGGDSSWRYICVGEGIDCRVFNKALQDAFPARGGGRNSMVQGSVSADKETLISWFDTLSSC